MTARATRRVRTLALAPSVAQWHTGDGAAIRLNSGVSARFPRSVHVSQEGTMATGELEFETKSLMPPTEFSRRGFLTTSLIAGFTLATGPVNAQSVITTDANGLTAGEVKVPVADGQIPAYRAMPAAGGTFPTVLVIQEIFGVHEHIKDVCRRFAKLGYYAVAPELFARAADTSKLTTIDEGRAAAGKTPDKQVMSDLDATTAFAKTEKGDVNRLGITGFCYGGRVVWLYSAHSAALKAGVAWYGRITGTPNDLQPKNPIDLVDSLKAPVLGLYGGADQGIPNADVEKMQAALRRPRSRRRSCSTTGRRTASTRTIVRATVRPPRRTAGSACAPGSSRTEQPDAVRSFRQRAGQAGRPRRRQRRRLSRVRREQREGRGARLRQLVRRRAPLHRLRSDLGDLELAHVGRRAHEDVAARHRRDHLAVAQPGAAGRAGRHDGPPVGRADRLRDRPGLPAQRVRRVLHPDGRGRPAVRRVPRGDAEGVDVGSPVVASRQVLPVRPRGR